MNLVQLTDGTRRQVALVDGARLQIISAYESVHGLANAAIDTGQPVTALVQPTSEFLSYDEVWAGSAKWHLLPPVDYPGQPHRTLISGTGLTHLASVQRRDAMHNAAASGSETDSMRMYRWGVEGGKPSDGQVGTAPEWFYKGNGSILRAHNEALVVPPYGEDGGEEPEVAGLYVIGENGTPYRIGFAQGNEFSDHKFERRNYLYLAHSKLRTCSLGPEIVISDAFDSIAGKVSVERDGQELWSSVIRTGEANMCHSLGNMEHHHFKYQQHREPGDVHIHFFGADAFSFGSGIDLHDGDVMQVSFEGFGRPLRNPLLHVRDGEQLTTVQSLAQ